MTISDSIYSFLSKKLAISFAQNVKKNWQFHYFVLVSQKFHKKFLEIEKNIPLMSVKKTTGFGYSILKEKIFPT